VELIDPYIHAGRRLRRAIGVVRKSYIDHHRPGCAAFRPSLSPYALGRYYFYIYSHWCGDLRFWVDHRIAANTSTSTKAMSPFPLITLPKYALPPLQVTGLLFVQYFPILDFLGRFIAKTFW
jgi:hypothetical protein